MGVGGSGGSSSSRTGTLNPAFAVLQDLFGANPTVRKGLFQPTTFDQGGVFSAQSFAPLGGLLANQPLSGLESFVFGVGGTPSTTREVVDHNAFSQAQAQYLQAIANPRRRVGFGAPGGQRGDNLVAPDIRDFTTTETVPGTLAAGAGSGLPDLVLADLLQARGVLGDAAGRIPELLDTSPDAAIALAQRSFSEDILPQIRETSSGFSDSDFLRESVRAGTDLLTNIEALREGARDSVRGFVGGGLNDFVQTLSGLTAQGGAGLAGLLNLGRETVRGTSQAGDALRVLQDIFLLTTPALGSTTDSSQFGFNFGL